MAEKIYTPEQVAEHFQVSLRTILNYLRDGRLKGFRVGRLWRIRESDLGKFIAKEDQEGGEARD